MGHWPNHTMSSGAKEKRWEQIRLETAVFWLMVKCSLELLIWSKELLCCGLDQFKIIPGFFPNISLSLTLSACNFSLAREDSEFTHSFVIPCLPILPFQSQISSHNISSYRIPATLSQKHNGWVRKKKSVKKSKVSEIFQYWEPHMAEHNHAGRELSTPWSDTIHCSNS